ncbi:hypothetical protein OPIT5_25315 [Opitutaceae bacterium TAV5]|nr:hypothetical protein OPIT5_25315 [Opitutaceae bacterium TAV5]
MNRSRTVFPFRPVLLLTGLAVALFSATPPLRAAKTEEIHTPTVAPLEPGRIACGNLIYAGNRSSVCFADKFLGDVAKETTLETEKKFRFVRLDSDTVFDLPFCVFSGEGSFTLTDRERRNLRQYLLNGGFLLSSPSCSNADWDASLRKEIALAMPEYPFTKIPMTHPVFGVLNQITALTCKEGNTAMLEGMEVNGRLVMIHSKEGLNDVGNAKGCCCCGGNEIRQSAAVNVNILVYALLY